MNAHKATLLNGVVLILMGVWGYFASGSFTAFIPGVFGLAFLLMAPGVKTENKVVAHVVVVLALVVLFALTRVFLGTLDRGDTLATIRVGLMILTTVIAFVYYVKSFIDARRARA